MQIPREELLATRYERIFAFAADIVIVAVVGAAIGFVLGLLGAPPVVGLVAGVILGLVWWPLFVMRDGERNGQTPGKQLIGLRTLRLDGEPFTFGSAFVREGLLKSLLAGLTFHLFLLVSWALSLGRSDHRALHDRMVETIVVRDAKRWMTAPADVVPALSQR